MGKRKGNQEPEGEELEQVLLVGVDTGCDTDFERSMEELGALAEAVGMKPVGEITQKLDEINKTYYIGKGKVADVRDYARTLQVQTVIFDNQLSPSQVRNLSEELSLTVMDRTGLILNIFAMRAKTREAKLQVEMASLQYQLPRLSGMGLALSRQGGGSGSLSNKGAGEKKLELDRRRIEHRIAELRKELKKISGDRQVQRSKRINAGIPRVALVGYTNAGKSTILNRMIRLNGISPDKQVLEEDMLFATLDTSVRVIRTKGQRPFLLTDTVGFIRDLPHGLIQSFRSTLEEVKYANLLVQVVDFSDPDHKRQMEVTAHTLEEIGAGQIPVLTVFNKTDLAAPDPEGNRMQGKRNGQMYLTALHEEEIAELAEMIADRVYQGRTQGGKL